MKAIILESYYLHFLAKEADSHVFKWVTKGHMTNE